MGALIMSVLLILFIVIGYYVEKNPATKNIPLGYFDENLHFNTQSIYMKGNHYQYISTPKYLLPYKKSKIFWVNISYYSPAASYDDPGYRPLKIDAQTGHFLEENGHLTMDVFMPFSLDVPFSEALPFDYPTYRGFCIVKTDDGIVLVHTRYLGNYSGKAVLFSLSEQHYTKEHLYTLGALRHSFI